MCVCVCVCVCVGGGGVQKHGYTCSDQGMLKLTPLGPSY